MKNGRNQTCFGKADLLSFHSDALWNAESVGSALLAFAVWELCSSCKEVDVGSAEVFEDLLKCLRVAVVEEGEVGLLFEEGQFFTEGVVGEAFACRVVVFLTPL